MHFVGNEGWITGGNSKLYHTTDEGQTFSIQNLPASSGITNAIFMRSAIEGYLVTSTGKVFRSTDAGNGNWTAIPPGTSVALYTISFPPTDTIGYACGNSGRIYRISPSRLVLDTAMFTATYTSIVCPVAADQAWVVGGLMRHRTATGWWADQFYDAGNAYNAIHFVDNINGWSVASGGLIIHTTDGIHWNGQISPTSNLLNEVFFLNQQEGWAVGNSVLLHTTDGGGTPDGHWQLEGQNVTGSRLLRAVFAVDNHAVYVVGNTTFLKYTQITDVCEKSDLPTSFVLHQNYPNPFNPVTNIQFSIANCQLTILKVYDVLGREVTTLVNEVKPPGTYGVNFDASNLSSGVYFCRIQTGDFVASRKLLFLK